MRAVVLFLLLCPLSAESAELITDEALLRAEIERLVEPLIGTEIVGCVVGVQTGDLRVVQGYGGITPGGPPADASTLFEIGSITKAFTGTLLADAANRGELSIDDPVNRWLPEGIAIETNESVVTLRHLATHSAGFPPTPPKFATTGDDRLFDGYQAEQLLEAINGWKPPLPPGGYQYSNFGVGLLGVVLERATGKTYEALIAERIAAPLGMVDTTLSADAATLARTAPPHIGAVEPGQAWNMGTGLRAAGAVRSTADDLLKLARAVVTAQQAGSIEDQPRVVQALKLATRKHSSVDSVEVGLCWHGAQDGRTWWHNGQTSSYSSWMSCSPAPQGEEFVNVVVLCNTANALITPLGQRIAAGALGHKPEPLAVEPQFAVEADRLNRYAGVYALSPFMMIDVRAGARKLFVRLTGQQELPVTPTAVNAFKYSGIKAELVFQLDGDEGPATSVTLFQNGMELPAPRVGDRQPTD